MPAKARVLIAEDHRSVCDLIRTHLQLSGYEVHIARDGVEALKQVRILKPDAMILDINMPGIDGFGVLAQLREISPVPIPVLVLTARHAGDDVRRAIALGARDFLAKPFNEGQLAARIARLLRAPPTVAVAAESLSKAEHG
jgi:DNA-binding response OmpR family regulator